MYKKRRLIKSIYIVFAMVFLLVLGQDIYTYVQSVENKKTQEKSYTKNNALISDKKQDKLVLETISSEKNEENIKEQNTNNQAATNSFFVAVYQNKVIVYLEDKKTVYEYTNIDTKGLPQELRAKLSDGFYLNGEQELYRFLESYSS